MLVLNVPPPPPPIIPRELVDTHVALVPLLCKTVPGNPIGI